MTEPPLVAVAHGSRDPAAQRSIDDLLDVVRARRPELDVRAAYVQNAAPDLPSALAAAGSSAARGAVVVPLLLSRGYHVAVDIARAAAAADAVVAPPLGPDGLLTRVLADRLAEAGVPVDLHLYAEQPHAFDAVPEFGRHCAAEMLLFLGRYVRERAAVG